MSDEWELESATSHEQPGPFGELDLDQEIDLDDASVPLTATELTEPIDDEPDFDDFAPAELAGDEPAELEDGAAS